MPGQAGPGVARIDADRVGDRHPVDGDPFVVVHARSQRLQTLLDAFLDRMCEWEHEDTPDLTSFVADEDEAGRGAA